MLKKKLVIFVILSLSLVAQSIPYSFNLGETKAVKQYKTSSETPASNTIEQVLVDENGTIWLATSRGLSKSTDNGDIWTNYYNSDAFGQLPVSRVGYHNGVIWAGVWHGEEEAGELIPYGEGLRYSTDEGNTWNEVAQPLDDQNDNTVVYGINTLDALPVTVNRKNYVLDIGFTSDAIWIATFSAGLRKSTDMGQTWQRVVLPPDYLDSISPNDTLDFDLSPTAGNLGFEENYNHRVFSIEVVNDSLMYVGTSGGLNKSTDGGISWRKFNHQNQDESISGNFVVGLGYDEYTNTVWTASWKANDLAEFWGVSASSDGGDTWHTYLPDSRPQDIGFKYQYSGQNIVGSEVFVAKDEGVYRSSNGGSTWVANPTPIDSKTGLAMPVTEYRSVTSKLFSDQSTDIWMGSLDGLVKINETQNAFWNGDWTIYVATQELASEIESYAFPNPFSPDEEKITILYSTGGKDAAVTIRIFDFGMNLVRTVIQNASRVGSLAEQKELWDGRDENGNIVPNGVYFYRVDLGSGEPIYGKIMVLM